MKHEIEISSILPPSYIRHQGGESVLLFFKMLNKLQLFLSSLNVCFLGLKQEIKEKTGINQHNIKFSLDKSVFMSQFL